MYFLHIDLKIDDLLEIVLLYFLHIYIL